MEIEKPATRARGMLVCLILASLLSGCHQAYRNQVQSQSSAPVLTSGPVKNEITGQAGAAAIMPPGLAVYRNDIELDNVGNQPVILDAVQIGNTSGDTPVPHLLGAYVVTTRRQNAAIENDTYDQPGSPPPIPVQGFRLLPGSGNREFPPLLVLKMKANGPRSYNQYVILVYHSLKGQRYVVSYPMEYLMCLKGPHAASCESQTP